MEMGKAYGYKTFDGEGSKTHQRKSRASPLSKLFFWWIVPIIRIGYGTELKVTDFDEVSKEDDVEYLSVQVQKNWNIELRKRNPNLLRASVKTFWKNLLLSFLTFVGSQVLLKMGSPVILGFILRNLSNKDTDHKLGAWLAAIFLICIFTSTILYHHGVKRIQHTGSKARIAFTGLLGQKALRLDQSVVAQTGIGQMVNLISNDMCRFDRGLEYSAYVFIVPLQFLVAIIIVWQYLGPSTLAAVILAVSVTIYQASLGRSFTKIRLSVAKWTDKRLRLLSELLNGLHIVKLFTWETLYINSITEARNLEISRIKRKVILQAINASIFEINTKLMILITFLVYLLTGGVLSSEKVFVVLSIFNSLAIALGIQFPVGSSLFAEILVSIRRIQEYLMLEERHCAKMLEMQPSNQTIPYVEVKNLSIRWPNLDSPVLSNISFTATANELVVIVGPVGSGKSSLLMALLSELKPETGSVNLLGSVAYAAQEAWLTPDTIRENILFGRDYDHDWYTTVVDACALLFDFESLQFGDQTNVADKGANLSGGQKARINLARACYSGADIYLLDDPISAVDTNVARHLLDKCIQGILKNKCVILVTHQTHLLPQTFKTIFLGTVDQINQGTEPDFSIDALEAEEQLNMPPKSKRTGHGMFQQNIQETQTSGRLKLSTVLEYFHAGNSWLGLTISVLLLFIGQTLMSSSDIWLKIWTQENILDSTLDTSKFSFQSKFVLVFALLIAVATIFSFAKTLKVYTDIVKSSAKLHARLLHSIVRAPMRFLEINTAGRILNRFTLDINTMDEYLPQRIYLVVANLVELTFVPTFENEGAKFQKLLFFQMMGAVVVVCISDPRMVLPSVVILSLAFALFYVNSPSASTIKRFDGIYRSPVLTLLSTTLSGLATIRAYGNEELCLNNFHAAVNTHTCVFMTYINTTRWFQLTFELLADFYALIVVVALTLFATGSATFGLVGSSLLTVILGIAPFSIIGDVAIQLTSPERVIEYSNVKPEAPLRIPRNKPSDDWPKFGSIRMDNLSVRYEDGPVVLQNIYLSIEPMEKIGIIGRTGAGKSSLIAALFRIVEKNAGFIHIDAVDVSKIGLHDLREKISIIPQNPFLFQGTVRRAVDPFGRHSDANVWNALTAVQLRERLISDGLCTENGGLNFSVGERQLLCIARTILLRNKIVVLDEATSNIDNETDRIIQKVIGERFKDCTMLIIAHRLNTVMDSDRILVLDGGSVVEFDEPLNLMQNPQSRLSQLVKRTGKSNAEMLLRRAKNNAKTKFSS